MAATELLSATGAISSISDLVGLYFQWQGIKKQETQANKQLDFQEKVFGENLKLGNRAMDLQEKQVGAELEDKRIAREQATTDKIMSGKMFYLNNLTRFFNTPETRASFATLWRK